MIKNIYQRAKNAYQRKGAKGFFATVLFKIKHHFFRKPYWTVMHYIHSNFRARRIPSFPFQGKQYNYLYSKKNFTWRNERSVEVPIGYNPEMDKLIAGNKLGIPFYFMKRVSKDNEWREAKYEEVRDAKYGYPFPSSNGIYIGIYGKN